MATDPYLMKLRLPKNFKHYLSVTSHKHFATATMAHSDVKPPNILLYMPNTYMCCPKECPVSAVECCLPKNRYVVYRLTKDRILLDPWSDNSQLLIIPSSDVNSAQQVPFSSQQLQSFKTFVTSGGKMLNFLPNLAIDFGCNIIERRYGDSCQNVIDPETGNVLLKVYEGWRGIVCNTVSKGDVACKTTLQPGNDKNAAIAILCKEGNGHILQCMIPALQLCMSGADHTCSFSFNDEKELIFKHCLRQLGILDSSTADEQQHSQTCSETPCYLLCSDQHKFKEFFSGLEMDPSEKNELKGKPSLHFMPVENFHEDSLDAVAFSPTAEKIPIIYKVGGDRKDDKCPVNFDHCMYFEHLTSKEFGKIMVYADITTSTMDLLEPLLLRIPPGLSVTCIAQQQTKGKGRGGNKWISPRGTAMFSLSLTVPLDSRLGQHLSILQHFTTVAVVHSIRSMSGLEDLDLRVKWPNDIYFGTAIKIGGVLVKSTIFKENCTATIGCGVNVDNKLPTRCINDLIQDCFPGRNRLTCEEVLAKTITCLEELINKYQEDGPENFLYLYYKYWIHNMADVQVQIPSTSEDNMVSEYRTVDATIIGLDEYGFLRVTLREDSTLLSLQPDGNSFDITKNLIAMKNSH